MVENFASEASPLLKTKKSIFRTGHRKQKMGLGGNFKLSGCGHMIPTMSHDTYYVT